MAREKGTGNLQREKSGRWTVRVGINGKRLSRSARTTDRDKAERFLNRFLAPLGLGAERLPLAEAWHHYEMSPNRRDIAKSTLASKEGPAWRLLMATGLYTGLRLGDCCRLSWENVNLDRQVIQVFPEKTKKHMNGRPVTIPIHPQLLAELESATRDHGNRACAATAGAVPIAGNPRLGSAAPAREASPQSACGEPHNSDTEGPSGPHGNAPSGLHGKGGGKTSSVGRAETRPSRRRAEDVAPYPRDGFHAVGASVPARPHSPQEDLCVNEATQGEAQFRELPCAAQAAFRVRRDEAPAGGRGSIADGGGEASEPDGNRTPHVADGQRLDPSASVVARSANTRSGFVNPLIAELYTTRKWQLDEGLRRIFKAANITMSVRLEGRCRKTVIASFHSLRHTFVSLSANAGVPLPVVQSIVGHTSTAMTRHYYHENLDALRAAVASIPTVGNGERVMGNGRGREANLVGSSVPLDRTVADTREGRACRDLTSSNPHDHTPPPRPLSPVFRLKRLSQLLAKGLITAEEHAAIRARILAEI